MEATRNSPRESNDPGYGINHPPRDGFLEVRTVIHSPGVSYVDQGGRCNMHQRLLSTLRIHRERLRLEIFLSNGTAGVHFLREILSGSGATKTSKCTRKRVTASSLTN